MTAVPAHAADAKRIWGEGLLDNEYASDVVRRVADTVAEYVISLEREPLREETSAVLAGAVFVLAQISPATLAFVGKIAGKERWVKKHDARAKTLLRVVKRHAKGYRVLAPAAQQALLRIAKGDAVVVAERGVTRAMMRHPMARAFVRELASQIATEVDDALTDDAEMLGELFVSGVLAHLVLLREIGASDVARPHLASWKRIFASKVRAFRKRLAVRGEATGFERAYATSVLSALDRLESPARK